MSFPAGLTEAEIKELNDYDHEHNVRLQTEIQIVVHAPEADENTPTKAKEPETLGEKVKKWLSLIVKLIGLILLLYIFICSLSLLSDSFILLGGRYASELFKDSELMRNPVCGLMIGVVCTAVLQSSSTSTSIVVTMVSAGLFDVEMSIPIIMGANIGTSITGILVASAQAGERQQFRMAFSGATVHDMFNWLSVIVLLPIEVATKYLFYLTTAIVDHAGMTGGGDSQEFLTVLTKPLTNLIVQVDKKVLDEIASGNPEAKHMSLLKEWCEYGYETRRVNATTPSDLLTTLIGTRASPAHLEDSESVTLPDLVTSGELTTSGALVTSDLLTNSDVLSTGEMPGVSVTEVVSSTVAYGSSLCPDEPITEVVKVGTVECNYLFYGMDETLAGAIVLVIALVFLVGCLILMVKLLKVLLEGPMAKVIRRTINSDFPGKAAFLTDYVAIIIGAGVTMLVQSSSVVTSALTPLVGIGVVSLARVFPLMLGANLGTTSTAILASFAASGDRVRYTFQIALCHLFFNLSGILIWFPIPFMRKIPLGIATWLGKTVSVYRWFAIAYLLGSFFFLPLLVFGLSLAGWQYLVAFGVPVVTIIILVIILNVLQNKVPNCLPSLLRTWDFLPEPMRSLAPYDRLISRAPCCKCCVQPDDNMDAISIRTAETLDTIGGGSRRSSLSTNQGDNSRRGSLAGTPGGSPRDTPAGTPVNTPRTRRKADSTQGSPTSTPSTSRRSTAISMDEVKSKTNSLSVPDSRDKQKERHDTNL